jgi:hypothetical protein
VASKYGSPRSIRVRTTFDFDSPGTLDKLGTTGRVVRDRLTSTPGDHLAGSMNLMTPHANQDEIGD